MMLWLPRSGRWGRCPQEPWGGGRRMGCSYTGLRGCTCAGGPCRRDTAWSQPPRGPWSPDSRCTVAAWPGCPWSTCSRYTCPQGLWGTTVLAWVVLTVALSSDLPPPGAGPLGTSLGPESPWTLHPASLGQGLSFPASPLTGGHSPGRLGIRDSAPSLVRGRS